jgi:Domain of Unknown Function (DUF1080)
LFNGKDLTGWEGETQKTWRVEDGAIVGGSLDAAVPRNEFLCTTKSCLPGKEARGNSCKMRSWKGAGDTPSFALKWFPAL